MADKSLPAKNVMPIGDPIEIVVTGLDPVIHLRKKLLRRWMDARIESGHDGCVLWREATLHTQATFRTHANLELFKQRNNLRHTFTASPRDAPEPLMNLSP
jgi:hypothetical protein